MLGFEDGASQGGFPPPEDWTAVVTTHVSSGAVTSGPECAARSDQAAPEDSSAARANENHSVVIVAIDELDADAYDLECEACGHLGTADTWAQAQAIARLHEHFVAVLVDRWEVS